MSDQEKPKKAKKPPKEKKWTRDSGEPPPLPEFVKKLAGFYDAPPENVARALLVDRADVHLDEAGSDVTVTFVPGNRPGGNSYGPYNGDCDIMVICSHPTHDDAAGNGYMSQSAGAVMSSALEAVGASTDKMYYTGLCKFTSPAGKRGKPKASHYDQCEWFLYQEIQAIKPKAILVLGSKVTDRLFGKTMQALQGVQGLTLYGFPAFVIPDPYSVVVDPGNRPALVSSLREFWQGYQGEATRVPADYYELTDIQQLMDCVDGMLECPHQEPWMEKGFHVYAVDCEWGGGRKVIDPFGAKLRTIQITRKEKEAFVIVLRREGLVLNEAMPEKEVAKELTRLFQHPSSCLAGHNLKADVLMMESIGVDCTAAFERGFDTSLMAHVDNSIRDFGLEALTMEFLDMGRYDRDLEEWKTKNGKLVNRFGYANVPDHILHPYAAADTDATYRLLPIFLKRLQREKVTKPYEMLGIQVETLYDLYRLIEHGSNVPLHEMEKVGLPADRERLEGLRVLFQEKADEKIAALREKIKWPTFNHRSVNHVREFLFGWRDTVAMLAQQEGKEFKSSAPEGAVCLYLRPVKTTEKPSRDWDAVPPDEIRFVNPGTDFESLSILSHKDKDASLLSEIRSLDQVLKSFLRKDEEVEADEHQIYDDDGEEVEGTGSSGLIPSIDPDGRIRTSISQLTDTGRHRSGNPNLQNMPKKTEPGYRKLFCPDPERLLRTPGWDKMKAQELKDLGLLDLRYQTIRSCLRAPPGYVLVESDYSSAELFVLAGLSGDKNLWDAMHDTSRDLHSEIAARGFNLPCSMEEAKAYVKKHEKNKRDAAKAVVYGLIYGRGPAAVVRAMQKDGIYEFSRKDAEALQEAVLGSFPDVQKFIQFCQDCVDSPGYVENPFGRRRYFPYTDDETVRAKQKRQAVNAPIQGTVADVLSLALVAFRMYKREINPDLRFTVVLPVHDQLDFFVHPDDCEYFMNEVQPLCMCKIPKIPHLGLELRSETDVGLRMAEPYKDWKDACAEARLFWKKSVDPVV